MDSMDVAFRFEIGQLVYLKTAYYDAGRRPVRYQINEQIAQRCDGGIQLLYRLVGMDRLFPELALTAEMPPFEATPEEVIQETIRYEDQLAAGREAAYERRTLAREALRKHKAQDED